MAPKSKSAAHSNGTAKGKSPSNSGTATPVSISNAEKDTSAQIASLTGGKPDKKVYDAEQAKIKSEIDTLQTKLSTVREKISLATKSGGPGNERQKALRAELDSIRDKQAAIKSSRGKQQEQINSIKENLDKKVQALQSAKSKIPYKTTAEVDNQIKNLEKQIDAGTLKLADEKRALQEISSLKRNRRTVESFQAEQDGIDADRKKIEELRKQYDDPEAQAISDRFAAIKQELDELKEEGDKVYQGRSKLFEERDNIQSQLKALFDEKRGSTAHYRDANDRYWTKVNEDRARRAEKARAQRAADEAAKKKEIAERLLEEAQVPAFQAQIEDCQTLIDYFSGKSSSVTFKSTTALPTKGEVAGVPKLELRQVEEAPEGLVALKKKDDQENDYFVAKKAKSKTSSKKNAPIVKTPTPKTEEETENAAAPLNVPLPTLSALLSLSIPPPASTLDVPRVIEDLATKKLWFEANQDRVTTENVAKAQAEIQRLTKSDTSEKPVISAEIPAEPESTPLDDAAASEPVSSEDVVDELEAVQEERAEVA